MTIQRRWGGELKKQWSKQLSEWIDFKKILALRCRLFNIWQSKSIPLPKNLFVVEKIEKSFRPWPSNLHAGPMKIHPAAKIARILSENGLFIFHFSPDSG